MNARDKERIMPRTTNSTLRFSANTLSKQDKRLLKSRENSRVQRHIWNNCASS
jgi:hypothetical protein